MRNTIYPELRLFDETFRTQGVSVLAGVDEAGRGPLAGSVFAAAVVLPSELELPYLNDSKKLSESRRESLYDDICAAALAFGIGEATVEEIETLNILQAAMLAMQRAVTAMTDRNSLAVDPELVLVDGNRAPRLSAPTQCVIGGDAKSASIAAASVLAKVTRDRSMRTLAEQYPMYGFAQHKGYGTAMHYQAIEQFGPSPVHRLSFLKKYNARKQREE